MFHNDIGKFLSVYCGKIIFFFLFFSIWVFLHEHSRFTRQQGKERDIFTASTRFTDTYRYRKDPNLVRTEIELISDSNFSVQILFGR